MLALLHLTQIRLAHIPAPHLLLGLFWGLHLSLVFGLVLPRLIFEIAQPRRYIDYPDVAALMVTATSVLAFAGTIALLLIVGLLLLSAVQQFRRG